MASPKPMLTFGIKRKQIKLGIDATFISNYHKQNPSSDLMKQLIDLLNKYESLFDDSFRTQITFKPPVTFLKGRKRTAPNATPWVYDNQHFDEQKESCLPKIIKKLTEAEIITKLTLTQPPKYLNSVDVIRIDNEFELNPDFKALNDDDNFGFQIERKNFDEYIEEQIFSIPKSEIFSKIVIKDVHYHFELDPDYRKYTTFKLRNNKESKDEYYQFNKLHPNMRILFYHSQKKFVKSFENFINQSIVRIFKDQILVLSETIEDHIVNLEMIFNHLSTAFGQLNLKISLKESMIIFHEIEICDFLIDDKGISIPSRLKEKLRDFQSTNLENRIWLRNFLVTYKKFCQISEPDYIKNKNWLEENIYHNHKSNYDIAVKTFQQVFLNSTTFSYESQSSFVGSSQSNLSPSSQSNLAISSKSNMQQNLPPNLQSDLPRSPQSDSPRNSPSDSPRSSPSNSPKSSQSNLSPKKKRRLN